MCGQTDHIYIFVCMHISSCMINVGVRVYVSGCIDFAPQIRDNTWSHEQESLLEIIVVLAYRAPQMRQCMWLMGAVWVSDYIFVL